MASQSAAAHIMKPVVSISMSPERRSSAESSGVAGFEAGALWGGGRPPGGGSSASRRVRPGPSGESWGMARQDFRSSCSASAGRADYGIHHALLRPAPDGPKG